MRSSSCCELRVLDRRQQLAQAGLELLDRDRRALGELVVLVLVVVGGADRPDRDLGAVLRVDRELALDEDDGAGRRALEALLDLLPGDRLDVAGAVGDDEADEVLAVLARAPLALADRERARDLLALGELADEDRGPAAPPAGAAPSGA